MSSGWLAALGGVIGVGAVAGSIRLVRVALVRNHPEA
jgi:hypothetical protein